MSNNRAMDRLGRPIVIAFAILLGACATRPSVTYTKMTSGTAASGVTDSYFLQTSTITIAQSGAQKGDATAADELLITSTATEYPEFKVGITSNSAWAGAVTTVINITKIENTALVKDIGSQISDKRVDTIKTIGGIVTTLIPLVGFAADAATLDASKLPWSTKTYTVIDGDPTNADALKPLVLKDGVTVTLGKLPPDAVPIANFPSGESNGFIYAACRDAIVAFTYSQVVGGKKIDSKHSKTVKIADPRFYEVVAFPAKGKITTHSECGVSVTTDADTGVSSGADIANALATQGKAIKDAIDAAKKPAPAAAAPK